MTEDLDGGDKMQRVAIIVTIIITALVFSLPILSLFI
jgi:hypothetical protein